MRRSTRRNEGCSRGRMVCRRLTVMLLRLNGQIDGVSLSLEDSGLTCCRESAVEISQLSLW